jgi:hypothetical protein
MVAFDTKPNNLDSSRIDRLTKNFDRDVSFEARIENFIDNRERGSYPTPADRIT